MLDGGRKRRARVVELMGQPGRHGSQRDEFFTLLGVALHGAEPFRHGPHDLARDGGAGRHHFPESRRVEPEQSRGLGDADGGHPGPVNKDRHFAHEAPGLAHGHEHLLLVESAPHPDFTRKTDVKIAVRLAFAGHRKFNDFAEVEAVEAVVRNLLEERKSSNDLGVFRSEHGFVGLKVFAKISWVTWLVVLLGWASVA